MINPIFLVIFLLISTDTRFDLLKNYYYLHFENQKHQSYEKSITFNFEVYFISF